MVYCVACSKTSSGSYQIETILRQKRTGNVEKGLNAITRGRKNGTIFVEFCHFLHMGDE